MSNFETVEMPQPLGLFAGELLARGSEYLTALKTLEAQEKGSTYVSYFLFAHTLELFFKSFLAAKGVSKKDLRKKLGHCLPSLFSLSEEHGIPVVAALSEFSAHTYEMNRDYDFRYPSGYKLSMPRLADCIRVAEQLELAIRPIVEPVAARANLQFASDTRHLRGKKIRWSD